jgi:hypothetical protein
VLTLRRSRRDTRNASAAVLGFLRPVSGRSGRQVATDAWRHAPTAAVSRLPRAASSVGVLLRSSGRCGRNNGVVAISDPTRKVLWSLAGNACALCDVSLVYAPEAVGDTHAIVGRECHIVARAQRGPRGDAGPREQIDAYDNLILLCANCHAVVDGQTERFPPHELRRLKREHEQHVATAQTYHRDRIARILDDPEMDAVRQQFLGIPNASHVSGGDPAWDQEMRSRLGAGLRNGYGPSAYLRGKLVRRAAEPVLADSPLAPINLHVDEVDGADVLVLYGEWSPRPVYMWLAVTSKDQGVVVVAANSVRTGLDTEFGTTQATYRFTTVDGAVEAVEDAVNWGLILLGLERPVQH